MRPPLVNYGWNPIESAPFDEDIALQVTDGRGAPYTLHGHVGEQRPAGSIRGRERRWRSRRSGGGHTLSRRLALNDIPPIPRALARSPSQHVKNIGTFEPSCS
jgi:hypothetical protein